MPDYPSHKKKLIDSRRITSMLVSLGYDPLDATDVSRYVEQELGFMPSDNWEAINPAQELHRLLNTVDRYHMGSQFSDSDETRQDRIILWFSNEILRLAEDVVYGLGRSCYPLREFPSLYISKPGFDYALSALEQARNVVKQPAARERIGWLRERAVIDAYKERPDLLSAEQLALCREVLAPKYKERYLQDLVSVADQE